MDKSEVEKTIEKYIKDGLVTRRDVKSMDLRPGAIELHEELKNYLKENGAVDNSIKKELAASDYSDFSTVIYDKEKYSDKEIEDYMTKEILIKFDL